MEKRSLCYVKDLKICYLIERDRHPELHYFLEQLKKNDLPTYKKVISFIDNLKEDSDNYKITGKFKKLKHKDNLWELKISYETRFFLFFSAEHEVCITHGYRKQRKSSKRLKQEIEKASIIKKRIYDEQ